MITTKLNLSIEDLLYLLSRAHTQTADALLNSLMTTRSYTTKAAAIRYLASIQSLDIANFFEHLRSSCNKGKSRLYINLMKEENNPDDLIITLSSYILQANIYLKKSVNKRLFTEEAQLAEATEALNSYYKTRDLQLILNEVSKIKANIKLWESYYRGGQQDEQKVNS